MQLVIDSIALLNVPGDFIGHKAKILLHIKISTSYLRKLPDQDKSCTDILQSLDDCFTGNVAMIDSDAVSDEDNELGGSRSEWIFGSLHQAKIAIAFWEFPIAPEN